MSARLKVEQLLIGWSRTSNGKNVLAKSPGWPSEPSRREWVSLLGDFLDPAIDRIVHQTGEVPWLLEFRPSEHGSILMAKVYAAESLRAGEFQVHAILDPTRTLGPQHLPGLAETGILLRDRPDDVTRLDTLRVVVPPVPAVREVRPLAVVLRFLHGGGPLLLRAATLAAAADLIGELAGWLPVSVAASIRARSVVTDVATAEGIAVAVAPWSRGAEDAPALEDAPIAAGYVDLARSLLDGEAELPDSDVRDWVELALLDPDTMSGAALARGLSGVHARDWLEAALSHPQSRALLVELMHRGAVPEVAWPKSGELAAELAVLLSEGARAQDAVAHSAPANWIRSWARQGPRQVVVQSPALVDRLRGLDLSPHDFRLHTGGTQWSEWNDEAWLQWLESGSPLRPGLRTGINNDGFAGHFAQLVDRLPRDMLDQASAQLMRWPADLLGALIEALVRCRNAPPELLIQTLDRLPPEDVRQVVHRHWPELGLQLGLPRSVVQALKPNRSWFG